MGKVTRRLTEQSYSRRGRQLEYWSCLWYQSLVLTHRADGNLISQAVQINGFVQLTPLVRQTIIREAFDLALELGERFTSQVFIKTGL